jgi:hypothetical protein
MVPVKVIPELSPSTPVEGVLMPFLPCICTSTSKSAAIEPPAVNVTILFVLSHAAVNDDPAAPANPTLPMSAAPAAVKDGR